jgi:hypothetical protein
MSKVAHDGLAPHPAAATPTRRTMIERLFRRKQLDPIEHRLGVVQTLVETI